MIILPRAAKNAPSMAWAAIFTASLVYMNHIYCKFGIYEPYLLQVWQRCFGSTKAIKEFKLLTQNKNHSKTFWSGFSVISLSQESEKKTYSSSPERLETRTLVPSSLNA